MNEEKILSTPISCLRAVVIPGSILLIMGYFIISFNEGPDSFPVIAWILVAVFELALCLNWYTKRKEAVTQTRTKNKKIHTLKQHIKYQTPVTVHQLIAYLVPEEDDTAVSVPIPATDLRGTVVPLGRVEEESVLIVVEFRSAVASLNEFKVNFVRNEGIKGGCYLVRFDKLLESIDDAQLYIEGEKKLIQGRQAQLKKVRERLS